MPKFQAPRTAQYPLYKTLILNATDTVGAGPGTVADGGAFKLSLPPGARVILGNLFVDTAFSAAATVTVGDSINASRYLGSTSVSTALDFPVDVPNFANIDGVDVLVTLSGSASTSGKVALVIGYIVDNRSNEVQIT